MVIAEEVVPVAAHPVMGWGAVWAGWLVTTGFALLLYVFGLALGFSAFNAHDPAAVAQGISGGAIAWMILTFAASLWLGAMFASWFDGRNDTEMGVVRGIAVWGLSLTATAIVVGSGATHLVFAGLPVPNEGLPQLRVEDVARFMSRSMWTAFGCALASLVTAAFGGWLGAHHVHHVYHLRTYAPHVRR